MKKEKTLKSMLLKNLNYNKFNQIDAIKKANDIIKNITSNITDNFLKYGNAKLPKSVARLDIPEVVTCCNNCKGCYAKKQLFENIKIYRLSNLYLINKAIYNYDFQVKFLKNLKMILKNHYNNYGKKACFRFHASGDIFSLRYFNLIFKICNDNKKISFYTYTKNLNIYKIYQNLKKMGFLKNLKINFSYIHGHANYFNFKKDIGFKEFEKILQICKEKKETIFLCNYSFKKLKKENQKKLLDLIKKYNDVVIFKKSECHCNSNCDFCIKEKTTHVAFIEH